MVGEDSDLQAHADLHAASRASVGRPGQEQGLPSMQLLQDTSEVAMVRPASCSIPCMGYKGQSG